METWLIDARCMTVTDQSLFTGTEQEMRDVLNSLSRDGWEVVAAYEMGK